MNGANINSWSKEVLRQIALELRKNPKKIRVFANRLRSKIAAAKSYDKITDNHWEWYAILTLWPTSEVIRLLEALSQPSAPLQQAYSLAFVLSGGETAASRSAPKNRCEG
jgi:hypothetical protein